MHPERLVADTVEAHLPDGQREADAARLSFGEQLGRQQSVEARVEQRRMHMAVGRVHRGPFCRTDACQRLLGSDPHLLDALEGRTVVVAQSGEFPVAVGPVEPPARARADRPEVRRRAGPPAPGGADGAGRVHRALGADGGDGEGRIVGVEVQLDRRWPGLRQEERLGQFDIGQHRLRGAGQRPHRLRGHLQVSGRREHRAVLDAVVGQVGEPFEVELDLPGGLRVRGPPAQQRVVEPAEPDLLDRRRLRPVPVPLPRVARHGHRTPTGVQRLPGNLDPVVVELGQRPGERLGLVLQAADRGQHPALDAPAVEALADRVAEDGVRADLQEQPVAVVDQRLHGGLEPHRVADVLPPVARVQFGARRAALAGRQVQGDLGSGGREIGERGEQFVPDRVHPHAVVGHLHRQEPAEDLLPLQFGRELSESVLVAGERDVGRAVDGGQRHLVAAVPDAAGGLRLGQTDGEHHTGASQPLLQAAAVQHHRDRVREVVHPASWKAATSPVECPTTASGRTP